MEEQRLKRKNSEGENFDQSKEGSSSKRTLRAGVDITSSGEKSEEHKKLTNLGQAAFAPSDALSDDQRRRILKKMLIAEKEVQPGIKQEKEEAVGKTKLYRAIESATETHASYTYQLDEQGKLGTNRRGKNIDHLSMIEIRDSRLTVDAFTLTGTNETQLLVNKSQEFLDGLHKLHKMLNEQKMYDARKLHIDLEKLVNDATYKDIEQKKILEWQKDDTESSSEIKPLSQVWQDLHQSLPPDSPEVNQTDTKESIINGIETPFFLYARDAANNPKKSSKTAFYNQIRDYCNVVLLKRTDYETTTFARTKLMGKYEDQLKDAGYLENTFDTFKDALDKVSPQKTSPIFDLREAINKKLKKQ